MVLFKAYLRKNIFIGRTDMVFDFEAWPRRGIYEFFSGLSQPFYSVTFTLDVTKLYACVKRRGLSFYYALTAARSRPLTGGSRASPT